MVLTDNYGSETSWTLTKDGSNVASGSGLANNTTYSENFDFGAGSYVLPSMIPMVMEFAVHMEVDLIQSLMVRERQ